MPDKEVKKDKEPEQRKTFIGTTVSGKEIYESVEIARKPMFLCWNGEKFSSHSQLSRGEEILLPYPKNRVPYRPYRIDFEAVQLMNPTYKSLMNNVYKEFSTFLDLENKFKILASEQVIETYLQHLLSVIAYTIFIGDWDSGKTRALELMAHLCYRPLFGIDISKANIYRYIGPDQQGHVSILEDEVQRLSIDKHPTKMAIYRSGYRRDAKVPIISDDASRIQKFFNTFCSKMYAGRYPPRDVPFNQRCLSIPMVTGEPEKDEILKEDIKRFNELRVKLLVYRMRHYWEPLADYNSIHLSGRVKELWKNKIRLVKRFGDDRMTKMFEEMALETREDRIQRRKMKLEYFLTESVVYQYRKWKGGEIPFSRIWDSLLKALGEEISSKERQSVESSLLGYRVTKTTVGLKLRSIFGGRAFLRHKLGRTWKFKEETVKRLIKKFGLTETDINSLNSLNSVKALKTENDKE